MDLLALRHDIGMARVQRRALPTKRTRSSPRTLYRDDPWLDFTGRRCAFKQQLRLDLVASDVVVEDGGWDDEHPSPLASRLCPGCKINMTEDKFSSSQLRKGEKARCKTCATGKPQVESKRAKAIARQAKRREAQFNTFKGILEANKAAIAACRLPVVGLRPAPINPLVVSRFIELRKAHPGRRVRLGFHGTAPRNFASILEHGLLLPGCKGVTVANGQAYGPGVYTSADGTTSMSYCGGGLEMFICAVLDLDLLECGPIMVSPRPGAVLPLLIASFHHRSEAFDPSWTRMLDDLCLPDLSANPCRPKLVPAEA